MTKTKSQLRAEAVERLNGMDEWCNGVKSGADFMKALLWDLRIIDEEHVRDALIYLLTDDEPQDVTTPEFDVPLYGWHEGDTREKLEEDSLQDSREGLEEDVRGYYDEHECDTLMRVDFFDAVYAWLDRQAAITEREYFETKCYDCQDAHDRQTYKNIERYAELQAKVDELEAVNEQLRMKLSRAYDNAHDTLRTM